MSERSLSEQSDNADDLFAAMSKAVAEGNTEEINRLMASEAEIVEKPESKEEEVVEEETPEETPNEEVEEEEAPEAKEPAATKSEQPPVTETDKTEAAKSAASTPTKDDEIAELKRELHTLRSDAGRMRHVQSRMHQLENELRALRARPSTEQDKPSTSAKKELPSKLQEKLAALKEIDPDLAETFESVVDMVQETKQAAEVTVHSKLAEREEAEFITEQWNLLTSKIPEAPKVFASPQWQEWKNTLTPGQRAMAESSYAVDVANAIHAFAADMKKLYGTGQSQSVTNSEGGDPTQTSVQAQVPAKTEVTEARNRKLATTAAVKNPAAKQVQEFDEEALFSEMYKELAKKNHIKY